MSFNLFEIFSHMGVAAMVVAAVLVVSSPLSILDPGFLLTFGATLAILVVVPRFDVARLMVTAPGVSSPAAPIV